MNGRLKLVSFAVLAVVCSIASLGHAATVTLYDGTTQSTTPDNFDRQRLAFAGIGGSQSYDPETQSTRLTTSQLDQAGYSNFFGPISISDDFPILNRHAGYTLSFTLAMLNESHLGNSQRAGWSVLVVSEDVASGAPSSIELGFQANRIFAQSQDPLFGFPSAAESTFNPLGVGFVDYDLSVLGGGYELRADGEVVLRGSLQDYTAFDGLLNPYSTANLVFLGDNTTSAGAEILLRRLSITAVPEPKTLGLVTFGGFCLLAAFGVIRSRRDIRHDRTSLFSE